MECYTHNSFKLSAAAAQGHNLKYSMRENGCSMSYVDLWAAFSSACENCIQQVARLPSLKLQLEEVRKVLSAVLMFERMDVVTACLFPTGLEWMSLLYFEYLG